STNETGFRIERRLGSDGAWEEIAAVGTNTTFFQNSGLLPGTSYSYRIASFNAAGRSDYSNTISGTTQPDDSGTGQIASPGNLQGAAISPNQINLTWIDRSDNETGFRVRRKVGIDGQWVTIANLEVGATSFQNTNLTPGTTYYYTVGSWNSLGESSPSNEVSVTAPTNIFIPLNNGLSARNNLLRNQTHYYQINVPIGATRLAIQTTGTGNIDLYVRYGNQPLLNVFNHRSISNSSSENSVFSYPAAGDWHIMIVGFSNNVSFYNLTATFQVGTSTELPAAPSNLSARVSSQSQVSLSWTDNSSNELLFRLRRRALSDGVWIDLPPVQQNTISYLDNTVTPGTTYFYSVTSINGAGTSAASNEVSVTTSGNENLAPNAPTTLVASVVSATQINLNWIDNSINETGFRVQRRLSGSSSWSDIVQTAQNSTSFQDTLVASGQTYVYRVIAFNTVGESAPSNEATAITPAVPAAPSGLRVTLESPTSVVLNWTDNSANETGFRVWRRVGLAGSFVEIGTTVQNQTVFPNASLAANTTYTYRVTSFNSFGDSGNSNEVSMTTPGDQPSPPAAPTGLTATLSAPTRVQLNWIDVSDNETGYRIRRRIGSSGSYTDVAIVGQNVNFYEDPGVTPNTTVFYRVFAFNNNGESSGSNEASVAIPGGNVTLPAAPTSLIATANTSSQVTLNWLDNSTNEIGFRIQRQNPDRSGWIDVATVAANTTTMQNSGLAGGMSFLYRVIAFNSSGASAPSNEAEVTTPEIPTNAITLIKSKSMTGVLQKGQSLVYRIQVPGEFGYLAVQTRGLGNVDVYMQQGSLPQMNSFACRSNGSTSNELCTINRPAVGDWYVLITSNSNSLSLYSVVADYGNGTPSFNEQGNP
ncbi:MAG: fibronectin type III domain-containing protein, partial [Acidobacteriota bacterium]